MSTFRIAIDPGASGAVAVRRPDGTVEAFAFTTESEAVELLEDFLAHEGATEYQAVLERVRAMPGQGVTSMFTFGANYGFWRGALQALRIPFTEHTPQQWQKGLMLGKVKGPDRKRALKQLAAERYPDLKPTLKTADALLMLGQCF